MKNATITIPVLPGITLNPLTAAITWRAQHIAQMFSKGKTALIINGTGHRAKDFPHRHMTKLDGLLGALGPKWEESTERKHDPMGLYTPETKAFMEDWLAKKLVNEGVTAGIVGGANGLDEILAGALFKAKIPYIMMLPFETQASRWPKALQASWMLTLKRAALVINVTSAATLLADDAEDHRDLDDKKMKKAMQDRNLAMLYVADQVWALHNGKKGETHNCITAALGMGMDVRNLWDDFDALVRASDVLVLNMNYLNAKPGDFHCEVLKRAIDADRALLAPWSPPAAAPEVPLSLLEQEIEALNF